MHLTYCIPKPGFHSGGWQVRSGLAGPGQTKFFADKRHGGKEAARQAAELFMMLPRPFPKATPRRMPRVNEAGVPGIRVRYHQRAGHGAPMDRRLFVSYVDKHGHHHCTSMSMDLHGTDAAIDRALDLRGLKGPQRKEARAAVLEVCRNGNHR